MNCVHCGAQHKSHGRGKFPSCHLISTRDVTSFRDAGPVITLYVPTVIKSATAFRLTHVNSYFVFCILLDLVSTLDKQLLVCRTTIVSFVNSTVYRV